MLIQRAFSLRARHLVLRPVAVSDVQDLYAFYFNLEVAQWLSRAPWPFTQESARTVVANAASDLRCGSGCVLAMTERETSAFVGIVSLRTPALDPHPWTTDAGLGISRYSVLRASWGAGFASEGVARGASFAFAGNHLMRASPRVARWEATAARSRFR